MNQTISLFLDETRLHLGKVKVCTVQNLGTLHFDPAVTLPILSIKDASGTAIMTVGSSLPHGVRVVSIELSGYQDIRDAVDGSEFAADITSM